MPIHEGLGIVEEARREHRGQEHELPIVGVRAVPEPPVALGINQQGHRIVLGRLTADPRSSVVVVVVVISHA